MILFKTINVLFKQLLPFVIVVLLGGSKSKTSYILYTIIAIAVISMIYSVINFFKTYFIIQDNELVLYTGIFNKKKMSIPFAKIQTINFEQNIFHQFFNVLRLKVDTAGSEKNEFEFHAIQTDAAYALRDLVMAEKKSSAFVDDASADDGNNDTTIFYQPIMSLSTSDLLKVGITENHLKSGGLIFLFFFWIYQNLQDVGVDVDEYSDEIPDVELGLTFISFIVAAFLVISILISMVRTVVQHYDLQFLRSTRGFKVISGLFTKKEISAFDHKIQHISWSDNLLKRMVGFKNLYLNQASSTEVTSKQNIKIPGCNMSHITEVVHTLFGKVNFENFLMHKIDKRYFYRFTTIISILFILLSGLFYYLDQLDKLFVVMLLVLYFIVNRYIGFRKKTYGHDGELLYIKGGVFGDKAEVLPIFKIQAIELHQSPYQYRNQLCNISLYTASGRIMIPYVNLNFAKGLSDIFLKKVEIDKRRWM